jgi:redox-sensitive bicupin YhaK (pirin superfamily)
MPYSKLVAQEQAEGAGARVRRLFPIPGQNYQDPFVLMDEFFVEPGAGFPDHPHRGFEVITYVLDGAMHHRDSMGNDGVVGPGGVQRITAGRGITHSEMPEGAALAHGIQLWINLAKAEKGVDAAYQQVAPPDLPEEKFDGYRARVVVGPGSPVRLHTPVSYLDVEVAPGTSRREQVPAGHNGLIYVVNGELSADGTFARAGEALACGAGEVRIATGPGGRYLFLAGKPHGEPVLYHGTFVD